MAIQFLNDQYISGTLQVAGAVTFDTAVNPDSDTDKFAVLNGSILGFRTGAEVLSDIGGASSATSVTSVTGTSPIISSEGLTPAISLNYTGGTSFVREATGDIGTTVPTTGNIVYYDPAGGREKVYYAQVADLPFTNTTGTVTSITPGADSGTGTAITTIGTITITGGSGVTTSVDGTTITVNAPQYSWELQGDTGGPSTIPSGATIDIQGGTGITTTLTGYTMDISVDGTAPTGTGTGGKLVKWATTNTLGNSIVTETTGLITVAGALSANSGTTNTVATFTSTDAGANITLTDTSNRSTIEQNTADLFISSDPDGSTASSTIKFQVDGGTKVTILDSGYVGIGGTPAYKLDISGGSAWIDSDWPFYFGSTNAFIEGNSTGTIIRSNATAGFKWTDGGTTNFEIDTDGDAFFAGRVAIGNTSVDYNADADDLIVGGGSGDTGITIVSGAGAGDYGAIYFADGRADGAEEYRGIISYEQYNEIMRFHTNTIEALELDLNQNATFAGTVGISIAAPTSAYSLRVDGNTLISSEKFHYFGGGNTGIGSDGSNNLVLTQGADLDIIFKADDGSGTATTYFYLDGARAGTDSSYWTTFVDNSKLCLGTSRDLQIFHDNANSYINHTGTGNLYMQSDGHIRLGSITDTEKYARFYQNAQVELFYNNIIKFVTTSTGAGVTGAITATTFSGELDGTITTATTAITQATADSSTKVATTAFVQANIAALPSGLSYQGTWDARTQAEGGAVGDKGDPALTSGVGTPGEYYIVSYAGTVDLDGIDEWAVGDWAVFTDSVTDHWQKIDNTSALTGDGTANSVAMWSAATVLTDAPLTFSGNNATITGDITATGGDLTLGADVSIFRDGVNILRTDDAFHANNDIYLGGASKIFDRANNATYIQLDHPDITFYTNGTAGTGNFTGSVAITSDLTVDGNTTLGDAGGDDTTINGQLTQLTTDALGYKLYRTGGGTSMLISAAGDAEIEFGSDDGSGTNTTYWTIGKDNTDNSFRISASQWLGISDQVKITSSDATFFNNLVVTGATITLDSAASASYIADRANDTSGATYEYKTAGTLKWYTGLRGLSNDNFYIFNNGTSVNTLILDLGTDAATFAGDILTNTDSSSDIGKTATRWANIWVDSINGGTPTTGGPYLPLTAGASYPLTGNLVGTTADFFAAGTGNDPIFHVKDTADTMVALFEGNRAGDTGANIHLRHWPTTAAESNRTQLFFEMKDDGDNITKYGTIGCFIDDNAGGTEDGNLRFSVMQDGDSTEMMRINYRGVGIGAEPSTSLLNIDGQQALLSMSRGGGSDTTWNFTADSVHLYIAEATGGTILTLSETGSVGIGYNPDAWNDYANNLVVYEAGNSGITIATNDTSTYHTSIYFADAVTTTQAYEGYIDYDHADNSLDIGTNHTRALTIDSSQNTDFVGKVGIGIVPTKQLTVSGADAEFLLSRTGAYADTINMGMPGGVPTIVGGTHLAFGGNGTWNEVMRIANTGFVGIGTTDPAATLQVGIQPDSSTTTDSLVHLVSSTAPSTINGFSTLKLDYPAGGDPDTAGAQIMFIQGYHTGDADKSEPVGSIRGWKTGPDTNYGGGLQLLYQPDSVGLGLTTGITLDGGGDTTFTGNVIIGESATAFLRLKKTAAGRAGVYFDMPSDTETSYIELDASEDMVFYGIEDTDLIFYAGADLALTLSDANATFEGNVIVKGDATVNNGLYPDADLGAELGNSSLQFSTINVQTSKLSDNVYMSGGQLYIGTTFGSDIARTENSYRMQVTGGIFKIAKYIGASGSGVWTDKLTVANDGTVQVAGKATSTATADEDGSTTLTTKGWVETQITGTTYYRGTWDPDISLNSGYGNPNLSSVTQTNGYYYICSADGLAEPNGSGTEPDSWHTGDWVVWNDDVGSSGEWQKIDNTSVLSGTGTGQTVAMWDGASSVTDSETLTNAPLTFTSNTARFAGKVELPNDQYLSWWGSNTRMIGNSDYLQLQVAAVDIMRLTSAGNVGINVTPPTTYVSGSEHWDTLQIGKNGVISAYRTNNEALFGTNTFLNTSGTYEAITTNVDGMAMQTYSDYITFAYMGTSASGAKVAQTRYPRVTIKGTTGNVGIGTTTPDEKLHITDSDGANIILNSDANTNDSGIYMSEGADATPTQNGAYIYYDAADNDFRIATGGGSLTDRLTIARDTGDVGIGIDEPAARLHVYDSAADAQGVLYVEQNPATNDPTVVIQQNTAGGNANSNQGLVIKVAGTGSGTGNTLTTYQENGSSYGLVVKGSGRVGINVVDPTSKLHVYEDANNMYTAYFYNSDTGANANGINVQTATTNAGAYAFRVNSASDTNALIVNGEANVGIGTANPTDTDAPLHIRRNSGASTTKELLRLDCQDTTHDAGKGGKIVFRDISVYDDTGTIEAVRRGATSASYMHFRLRNSTIPLLTLQSDGGSVSGYGSLMVNTNVVPIGTGLTVNSGIAASSTTAIEIQQATAGSNKAAAAFGVVIQNGGESTNAADLYFSTASAGSLTRWMTIRSTGVVGIGVNYPEAALSIQANYAAAGSYTTDGWAKYIILDAENTGGGGIIWSKQSSTYNRAILNNQGQFQIGRSTANDASAAWLADLVIDPDGYVGIGTADPGAKLDITGGVTATPITNGLVRVTTTGVNPATGKGGGIVFFQEASTGVNTQYASITGRRVNNASNNKVDLDFNTGDPIGGVSIATRMTIMSDGNIGIGTSAPTATLEVNGDIKGLGGGSFAAGVTFSDVINLQDDIDILNKAQTSYISLAARDTSGSEVVYNLSNIGSISMGQKTDIGALNTTNLESGAAVGLSLTYPTSNVAAGDGLAIAIGIAGRGRSYIANSNVTDNLDASNLVFYTEGGGVIGERMIIDTNGNVGIGTDAPTATLQVTGGAIKIGSGAGSGTDSDNMSIQVSNATYGDTANLGLLVRNNGANDDFAQIGFGYSETKCPVVIGSVITSGASATKGDFIIGTRSTTTGSDAPTERMRIDSSGNVGIGTSTMNQFVNITSGSNTTTLIQLRTADGSEVMNFGIGSDVGYLFMESNTAMTFGTNGGEKMRIDSTGRVAIGNTTSNSYTTGLTVQRFATYDGSPNDAVLVSGPASTLGGIFLAQEYDSANGNFLNVFSSSYSTGDTPGVNWGYGVRGPGNSVEGTTAGKFYSTSPNDMKRMVIQQVGASIAIWSYDTATTTAVGTVMPTMTRTHRFLPSGALSITGALSKGSGSFKIDHPLEAKKDTHDLVHSFVEGPQADLIYRGKVDLVSGAATINIDTAATMTEGTFVLLNTNVQCFTTNETDWDAVKGSVSGNILTIACKNSSSTATISWMVIGERHDKHMIDTDWTDSKGKVIVEPEKEEEEEE